MRKKLTLLLFIIVSFPMISGCAYLRDRGRDVADIFSLTVVNGLGVSAQASAINTGLGYTGDIVGIEDGTWIENRGAYTANGGRGGIIIIGSLDGPRDQIVSDRGKDNSMLTLLGVLPVGKEGVTLSTHYWTKFELGAALGYGVKAGFNPGELLDFFLGIFCVDIYGDDINEIQEREKKKGEGES